MKNFTCHNLWILLLTAGMVSFFTSNGQSFSHPSASLVVSGDLMHAAGGDDFIGAVYSRNGGVYYNRLNSDGTWGDEFLLGPGSEARLVIDNTGNPHVAFNNLTGQIVYQMFDGIIWTPPLFIESLNQGGVGSCSKPDIAVDGSGGVHVTYTDSHGATDPYNTADIMYASKTNGAFNIQLIFNGYRSLSSSGTWDANYYQYGSYIAVTNTGDYYIMTHRYYIYKWSFGSDKTYYLMVHSNLGNGNISNYGSNIFAAYDLEYDGTTVRALYQHSTNKASELALSGTTISFTNTADIPASSVSSVVSDGTNLVVGGMNGTFLFTQYNDLDETYLNTGAKNNLASVVQAGNVFYVLYTDNTDGLIKIKEVALPLSFMHYEVPGQSEPAYINGQAGTIEVKVEGGTDLANLVATYQTTSDVTGVSVASVPQTSGVTSNDFSSPVTYTLTDGTDSRNWVVDISVGILDTMYASICEGDSYSFGASEYSTTGEYTETFTASDGSDSTVLLILTVNEHTTGSVTAEVCESYTAPDGTVYYTSGTKTAVIPNAAGCDSVITINLTVHPGYTSQLPAQDNLVAYYSFNGNANDLSGNHFDGAVNGATLVPDRLGNPDGAYAFDGVDDYIDLGDWENGGAMSFAFWARWDAFNNYSRIIDLGNGSSSDNIVLSNRQTNENFLFSIYKGSYEKQLYSSAITMNQWDFYAATVNETGEMTIYKNGLRIGKRTDGYTPNYLLRTKQYIGKSNFGTQDDYFKGAIDEMMIYDTAMTEEEIMELFQQSQYFIPPVYATVCENELPFEWNGNQYTESGEYVANLTTIHGCDSIVTLQLEVLPAYRDTTDAYACENELPYTWQGMDLTETGFYSDTLTSEIGCDSILILNFNVVPVSRDTVDYAACANELPYTWQGQDYAEPGFYSDTLTSVWGCDSILTLNLSVNPSYSAQLSLTANLVAYYNFNGHAEDQTANANHGTVYGATPTTDRWGNENRAYAFDGTDDYIVCPTAVGPFGNASRSISFWAKTDVSPDSDLKNSVLSYGNNTVTSGNRFEVMLNGRCRGVCVDVSGNYLAKTFDNSDNGWHHYVIVFDNTVSSALSDVKFYADGQLLSTTCSSRLDTDINTGDQQVLNIGRLFTGDRYFKGSIDEIKIYDKALTESEVQEDFHQIALPAEEISLCESETPYTFGTKQLTESGTYTETFQTVLGCDSVVTLHLTVYPVYDEVMEAAICEGQSYDFGDTTYTDPGVYTHTFSTINGCDSLVALTLTVNPIYNVMRSNDNSSTDIFLNESFEQTAINTFPDDWIIQFEGTGEEDHFVVDDPVKNGLHAMKVSGAGWSATLSKPVENMPDNVVMEGWMRAENVESGGRCGLGIGNPDVGSWGAFWGRVEFFEGNLITYNYTGNSGGYGTIYVLQPALSDTWYHVKIDMDVAAETYKVYINGEQAGSSQDGQTITEFPILTGLSANSAIVYGNSLVYFDDIKMYESDDPTIICESETPYSFGEQSLYETGMYTESYQTIHGCDSTVSLHLIVNPVYNHTEKASICEGESYDFGETTFTEPGEYQHTFSTINGCDSVVTLTLTVNPACHINDTVAICPNDLPYTWQSLSLSAPGIYSDTLTSTLGCDSILTLNFNVYPDYNVYDTVSVYEVDLPYVFNSKPLTEEGNYTELFTTVYGCDSLVTLTLVIDTTDIIQPNILCRNTELRLDENGLATLNVEDAYSYVYDASGIKSVKAHLTDFTCDDIGVHQVRVTATDNFDNSFYCTALITVKDDLPPVFSNVADLVVATTGNDCTAEVDYPDIVADDNCGVEELFLLEGLGPDGRFPLGTTTESWVAVDASGNSDTISFTVTVEEAVSDPGFDPVEDLETDEDSGWATIELTNVTDGSPCFDYQTNFEVFFSDQELIAEYQIEYTAGDHTGYLKVLPAPDAYGESQMVIKLRNTENGKEHSDTLNIKVLPVNDPPYFLESYNTVEINTGDTLVYDLGSGYNTIFGDIDDDVLEISLEGPDGGDLPDWIIFRDDSLFLYPLAADTGCIELMVEIKDPHGATADSPLNLCVSPVVGIDDLVLGDIRVYPNPTNGKVYIDLSRFKGTVNELTLITINGSKVMHRMVNDEIRQELDLSHLTSGIYILKVTGNHVNKNFRIVLKTE